MAAIRRRGAQTRTDWVWLTEKLVERAQGHCERCGRGLPDPFHRHHRKLRSQGGLDTLANLVAICKKCHETVHLSPMASYKTGFIVKGGKLNDPAESPLDHAVHGRIMLLDDGSFTPPMFDIEGGG